MATITAPVGTPAALGALDAAQIDQLAWQPVRGCPGVHIKELWRLGDFVHALVRYAPGSATTGKPHLAAHHHIWIVSGRASIAGQRLTAGAYLHIPPGAAHPIDNVGPDGCTLLHLHSPYQEQH